jgi:hypothetical protein
MTTLNCSLRHGMGAPLRSPTARLCRPTWLAPAVTMSSRPYASALVVAPARASLSSHRASHEAVIVCIHRVRKGSKPRTSPYAEAVGPRPAVAAARRTSMLGRTAGAPGARLIRPSTSQYRSRRSSITAVSVCATRKLTGGMATAGLPPRARAPRGDAAKQ